MRDERFTKPSGNDWITGEAGRGRMVRDSELESFTTHGTPLNLRENQRLNQRFVAPDQPKSGPMVSDSELDKFEAQARASAKRLGLYGGRDEEAFGKSPGQGGYSY
ncbi:MAG TPA: hypothetical protein VKG24_03440 [Pseudolabrys sp.]|nr:hypothetical protein [Pseudolabrys sp.]